MNRISFFLCSVALHSHYVLASVIWPIIYPDPLINISSRFCLPLWPRRERSEKSVYIVYREYRILISFRPGSLGWPLEQRLSTIPSVLHHLHYTYITTRKFVHLGRLLHLNVSHKQKQGGPGEYCNIAPNRPPLNVNEKKLKKYQGGVEMNKTGNGQWAWPWNKTKWEWMVGLIAEGQRTSLGDGKSTISKR